MYTASMIKFFVISVAAITVLFTPENLLYLLSVAMAVLMDWFPPTAAWFNKFTDGQKRLFMTGGIVVIAFAVWGLGCAGYVTGAPVCTGEGAKELIPVIVMAIVINQGIHAGTKPSTAKKAEILKT